MVISSADGIVQVEGMDKAVYGEIVTFDHLDCGNFDDMLRKAFEHENIDSSYKANGLIPIYIRHPKLPFSFIKKAL